MRLYRLLLRLYPPAFRRRYGSELEAAFAAERIAPRYAGTFGACRFWLYIIRDLVATAVRRRVAQARAYVAGGVPRKPVPPKRTDMETILQDVRHAWRSFGHRPGFSAVAVLSLALGIGGTSLMYGAVDGFVLRPFPYPDQDRLIAVGVAFPKLSDEVNYVEVLSPAEYADIRTASSFARTAAFDLGNRHISGSDVPERVFTALLLDDPFPVVGMLPAVGRGFTREELAPNGPRVAIISDRLWQSRFGGDPGILNTPIRIGGEAAAIVGVMPPGLLLMGTDMWIPWGGDPAAMPRNVRQFTVLARLAPGVTMHEARAEVATIASRVEQAYVPQFKEYEGWRLMPAPWASAMLRDVRPAAFLLLGAVGLVLLIACANLTNLLLARSTTRARELAVRLALGAARWRVVRHLLTESVMLALAGAAVGLVIAFAGLRGIGAIVPAQFRSLDLHAGINVRVLLFSIGVALVTGVLVGLLPALQAARTDPHESLKADGRAGAGRSGARLRATLVVAELALSLVLLLGAGLMMRSFMNINNLDTGLDPRGVLTMRLTLPREQYRGEAINGFFDRLIERIGAVPGVRSAAAASQFPPMATFDTSFMLEREVADPGAAIPTALITVTTPALFETLRVPIRMGRAFTSADRLGAQPVAIVNETFARRFVKASDPIGQRIALNDANATRPWMTIVGIVADVRNGGATRPVRPEIFTPVGQQTAWNQLFVLVRGAEAATLLPSVREVVRALDPEQPVYAVQTLERAIAQASFQQRAAALLLSIFAGVALVMAAIGIFGVMSYVVTARTREMGVRLAMGAQRRDVVWLVLSQVVRLASVGLALGIGLLLASREALSRFLFGVDATDVLTMAGASLILVGVALIAAWLPAARSSRIDPVHALRCE